ncbi:hypothetical protein [Tenuifilum thalassicum]|uniref:Uncharacterized protein n=1 Tax=Tenuifilum thalassicum TaxID=2590900 RepID=A0A7D3XEQ5_9BACT|nr:hypothetical protein [Tenuifilum thalassicum]QKG80472.1 hypothetical protein FHG85_09410 [Tenuifilum thalassicum]
METLNEKELRQRLFEYSNEVGFKSQTDSLKEIFSFLMDIDQNFVYTLLKPEEAKYISAHREIEDTIKQKLEYVISSL